MINENMNSEDVNNEGNNTEILRNNDEDIHLSEDAQEREENVFEEISDEDVEEEFLTDEDGSVHEKIYEKKISVIVAKTNDSYEITLDRILEQQNFDLSSVEVIIEDSSGMPIDEEYLSDISKKVSVTYEELEDADLAALYNAGLKKAKGEIINFINTNSFYSSKNVFVHGSKSTANRTVILNVGYHDRELDVRTVYPLQPTKSRNYNLEKEPYGIPLNILGYFVHATLVEGLTFDGDWFDECDIKFILDLIRNNTKYYYRHNSKITSYEPFENNTSKCAVQYKEWWYKESLENYLKEMQKDRITPVYLQEAIMYLIHAKINCNLQDRNKGIVPKENYEEFVQRIFDLLCYVDDKIILQHGTDDEGNKMKHWFKIPRWIKTYLLKNKYRTLGLEVVEYCSNNKVYFTTFKDGQYISKTYISDLSKEKATIYAINKRDNTLYFDCSTTVIDFLDEDRFDVYAELKSRSADADIPAEDHKKRIEVKHSGIYPLMKIFGKTIAKRRRFILEINLDDVKVKDSLSICGEYNGITFIHNLYFSSVYSRLSEFENSYWNEGKFLLVNEKDSIFFEESTFGQRFKHEYNFDKARIKKYWGRQLFTSVGIKTIVLILFRWLYFVTRPFYKNKHIWMAWDKLYKAGDNGEYMYQYCLKDNKANVYYLIKKDSPDYKRLKKQCGKRVLVFKSFKARFIALHSEVILNTHANIVSSCGFDYMAKDYVCGLFNPEVICIQHGLTIQKIAQYQNRLFDNIKLYCCASEFETENISDEMYGYSPESIKLTGLARYDGLKSNDQKIILITPTWRRNVVNSSVAHIKKTHNDNFKNSEYFKIYNSLINNKELIDCANETGYKLIYLLHPAMSGQLEDFDRNEFVDIIPATGDINYEKILTESSLMVTDYSGVQFDFAYQRKPLVYYHPDRLPPHYDAGGLDYETMGFGPVCKNEEQIIGELCDYMRNQCRIKDKYRANADKFFYFDDFNNCERIYGEIMAYLKKINRI